MTVAEFIKAFGGPSQLGGFCGVGVSAVSNWKKADRLPAYLHYKLSQEAQRRKIAGADALFDAERGQGRAA